MIRARRGFPVSGTLPDTQTGGDAEVEGGAGSGGDIVERMEDDVSSSKTHESSVMDTEVCFPPIPIFEQLISLPKPHPHHITFAKLTSQDSRALASSSSETSITNLIPSPTYCRLSDLPSTLLDYVNNIPDSIRKSLVFRRIFEAAIAENTAEDEPDAPPITVINEIDDEPTPPWEFFYSNKLWYHEDVPPPDYDKLVGCNCVGECDPESETCACLTRQTNLWPDGVQSGFGFSYDEDGMLKNWDETIVECNDLCQCTNKCRNRVSIKTLVLACCWAERF